MFVYFSVASELSLSPLPTYLAVSVYTIQDIAVGQLRASSGQQFFLGHLGQIFCSKYAYLNIKNASFFSYFWSDLIRPKFEFIWTYSHFL